MGELEAVHVDDTFAFGVIAPVVISVWRAQVTLAVLARALPVLERCVARVPGPSAYLSVVEPTSRPPPLAVHAELRRRQGAAATLGRMAVVIERNPTWLARGVDALAAIVRSTLPARQLKVCVDVREAACWLGRQRDPEVEAALLDPIERAVETLRASLPPHERRASVRARGRR